ncbi:MAG: MG2 domain-containing protein [Bacteroidota bacterium]|nr:MG2 domain-containing protein [Bacteroidota bacterium]
MKCVNLLRFGLLFCAQLFCLSGFSQNSDTLLTVRDDGKIPLFFEKVYLHLDRNYYSSGEDIWFKAYLMDPQKQKLSRISRNLYVELIAPGSKIISREIIKLENGLGRGDFKLKDSIPEGTYQVRAYTSWMLNFGSAFVFTKDIEIHSLKGIKDKVKYTIVDSSKVEVGFYPEGGSMLEGVEGAVGFKVLNALGKSDKAFGKVVSSGGDTVAWIESVHLGMGKFTLLPKPGESYYAIGKVGNVPFRMALPKSETKGISMRYANSDTANIIFVITASPQTLSEYKDSVFVLKGRCSGVNYVIENFVLTKAQVRVKVPKSAFPGGIACFTLYDKKNHAYSERLVYIDSKEKVNVSVVTNKKTFAPREPVMVRIVATDRYKNPINANLSLAAVDADQVSQGPGNIVSYFQLESEIKGNIERPEMYFDTTNQSRFRQLDLLLLTQGWRNFVWHQFMDTSLVINRMPEQGITISGRVRQKFIDKPIKDLGVILLTSINKKSNVYLSTTNADGKYLFNGLDINGSCPIVLTSKSKGGKNRGWILRDSMVVAPFEVPFKPTFQIIKPEVSRFALEADARQKILKKYSLSDTIMLSEVLVKGQSEKAREQERDHMIHGGIADYSFKIEPDDAKHYYDVYSFLMSHLPGATRPSYTPQNMGYLSPNRIVVRSMGQERSPSYALNGMIIHHDQEDIIESLSMEEIDRIFISRNNIHGNYAVSIFTKPGGLSKKDYNILSETVTGFYQARTFYSTRYNNPSMGTEKEDLRTTIHWIPNIKTNEKGEAMVRFFNADKPTSIRVTVEGVSENGKPTSGVVNYVVK